MSNEETRNKFDNLINDLKKEGIIKSKEDLFRETMEKGRAINRIHKDRLYKGKFHSFESCVEHVFGFTSQQARNLMVASETYDMLRNKFTVLPDNAKKLLQISAAAKREGVSVEETWFAMMQKNEIGQEK